MTVFHFTKENIIPRASSYKRTACKAADNSVIAVACRYDNIFGGSDGNVIRACAGVHVVHVLVILFDDNGIVASAGVNRSHRRADKLDTVITLSAVNVRI